MSNHVRISPEDASARDASPSVNAGMLAAAGVCSLRFVEVGCSDSISCSGFSVGAGPALCVSKYEALTYGGGVVHGTQTMSVNQ